MFTGTWGWRFRAPPAVACRCAADGRSPGLSSPRRRRSSLLLAFGVIGTMNPSGSDVSVVQPIEQSLLPLTTTDERRSHTFARYSFFGGALAALGRVVGRACRRGSIGSPNRCSSSTRSPASRCSACTRSMSPQVEAAAQADHHRHRSGHRSASSTNLAALFSLDSFGGGFAVQSLLVLWLLRRHHFSVGKAGAVLAVMQILSAASGFVAVRIERRHRSAADDGVHASARPDPADQRRPSCRTRRWRSPA